MSEILLHQYGACPNAGARARWLLDVPVVHLLDRDLAEAIQGAGSAHERDYLSVVIAWLHATGRQRAALCAALATRLDALGQDARAAR